MGEQELFDEATANPEFRASVQRMLDDPELHVRARPGVYEVAAEVHPGQLDEKETGRRA
jgi:hypothetical protein